LLRAIITCEAGYGARGDSGWIVRTRKLSRNGLRGDLLEADTVTHLGDFFRTSADREECVPTAEDRLVGVVSIQVQAPATENLREDVARL
jgi:hypothetical protein